MYSWDCCMINPAPFEVSLRKNRNLGRRQFWQRQRLCLNLTVKKAGMDDSRIWVNHGESRVIIWHQTKQQALLQGKSLNNYDIFALFDPPKTGNLMIPVNLEPPRQTSDWNPLPRWRLWKIIRIYIFSCANCTFLALPPPQNGIRRGNADSNT